jgi:CRISPR-associated protein Csx17
MTVESYTHELTGCAPIPLAHYLKALGVLRLVSEGADPKARGWWSGGVFHLRTTLNAAQLCRFFLEEYRPTPLVGPWGARSGFFSGGSEKSAREALSDIESSELPRLQSFGAAIRAVRQVLSDLRLSGKADTPEDKRRLMMHCRATLPDELLPWLDATYMLLDTETKYPPLLGTGGNEGSGSYMSGFAQQVVSVILHRDWDHALHPALFGLPECHLASPQTPGHFSPEAAGGPNAASACEGGVATNPWDYLLLLEGTLLFAAACVKRMEHRDGGVLGYPFCVRPAGVGYGSAATSDEGNSRAEMWLPLWSRPTMYSELSALFCEGRAQVASRPARNGVDFARALAALGTDRGIAEFQRYAFQQRNGLSYFAVPLGRFNAEPQPQVDLLADPLIDEWLERFRRAASSNNAPSAAARALRRLEMAILDLCQEKGPGRLQAVLVAFGDAEAVLAVSTKWRAEAFQRPVPLLAPQWLTECDDRTPEFRLAASLAGLYSPTVGDLRQHLEPVETKGRLTGGGRRWADWIQTSESACNVVWSQRDLEDNLIAVLQRRSVEGVRHGSRSDNDTLVYPGESNCFAAMGDVSRFLRRETDDERIAMLVRGLTLLDWVGIHLERTTERLHAGPQEPLPDALFAMLKLCHSPYPVREVSVPFEPAIARLAVAGRLDDATRLAARRLRASRLASAVGIATRSGPLAHRIVAALVFPISWSDMQTLAATVLKAQPETHTA